MGNCQAIDNASLVIQHPSGRADKHYMPIAASEVMKMNPGHYVALLLTTTLYSSPTNTTSTATKSSSPGNNNNKVPVRVTRIKLLRPTDTLTLGHVYRLITTQEVMKGLLAKKQSKMMKQHPESADVQERLTEKESSDSDGKSTKQGKQHHRLRNNTQPNIRSRGASWQPALKSISEAGT